MRLFHRINRMLSARMHDAVDRLADPRTEVRHAVRELTGEVERLTHATAESIAAERLIEQQMSDRRQAIAIAQEQAAAAIAASNEALARQWLNRRLDLEAGLSSMSEQHARLASANSRLRAELAALRARHASAQGDVAALVARLTAAEIQARADELLTRHASSDANQRIEQFESFVLHAEAKAGALAELAHGVDRALVIQAAADKRKADIEAELAKVKQAAPSP